MPSVKHTWKTQVSFTIHPILYARDVLLCFVIALVWLPECRWSNSEGYIWPTLHHSDVKWALGSWVYLPLDCLSNIYVQANIKVNVKALHYRLNCIHRSLVYSPHKRIIMHNALPYYTFIVYEATTETCVYFGVIFFREVRFYLFQYTIRTVQIFVKDYEILLYVLSRLTFK